MKYKNFQMKQMIDQLQPILSQRNKIGYIAARNTRKLEDALVEYRTFEQQLITKYGAADTDENGKDLGTISLSVNSPNFSNFIKELEPIQNIEHEVELMRLSYDDVIDFLSGEEILAIDWMLNE